MPSQALHVNSSGPLSGQTQTITLTVAAGNTIVLGIKASSENRTFNSVTDDLSNNLLTGPNSLLVANATNSTSLYYYPNESGGTRTLTITFDASSATTVYLLAAEYGGLLSASFDKDANNFASAASVTATTAAVSQSNELVVALGFSSTASRPLSVPTATGITFSSAISLTTPQLMLADGVTAAGGAIAVSQACTGGNSSLSLIVVTFKLAPTGLQAAAADVASASAALSTQIRLGAAAADVESSTGALTTAIRLAASAVDSAAASGAFAAGAVLTASALDVATATAALSTAILANGQAVDVATANGTLTNWASVVLSGTLYTGQGGALDSNFWLDSVPQLGTTLYYDATHITIFPNGEISSDVANCSAVVQFFDGTSWALGLVVFTDQLAAVVKDVASSSAAMSTAINLAAAASALATAAAAFSTGAGMNAAGSDVVAASGALTTKIPLSALAADVASATGALTTQIRLTAAATDVATANAQLNGIISLQAAANSVAAASAALTAQITPAANAQVQATGVASMTTAIKATASAADIASAAASLSSAIVLIAQAVDASSSTAALTTSRPLAAAAIDLATAIAVISTGIRLSANDVSIAQATADLSAGIAILANATAQASATAVLTDIISSPPIDAYQVDPRYVISASMIDESIGRRTPRFISKDPLDRCVLCFDFADQLEEGETLTGKITLNVAAIAGSDPSATGILVGVPSYNAAHTKILQPIFGGVDACRYYIKVAAATTNPQKSVSLAGLLPVAS